MKTVFVVHHIAREGAENEDTKLIGVYTSNTLAMDAVASLRELPGFSDHPDGFTIDPYELDNGEWDEGFISA